MKFVDRTFKADLKTAESVDAAKRQKSYTFDYFQQLWKKSQANDFSFYDPHSRVTPSEYNPLHDPNLKSFFMRNFQLNVSDICITNQP